MNKHLLLEITTPSGVVRQDIRIPSPAASATLRGQAPAPIRVPLTETGSMTLIDKATGKPVRIRKSTRTDGNLVLELDDEGVAQPEIVLQNFDDAACVLVGAPNQSVNDTTWPPQNNPLHSNQLCDPGTEPLSFKWPEALAASGVSGTGLGLTLQSAGAMAAVAETPEASKTAVNNTVVGVAPITGKVVPGAKVVVKDSMGNVLGETTADPVTGEYALTLTTRPTNQTAVQITIADSDGTVLETISVPVDLTPPATPTVIAASSTEVRGVADPGTTVRLIDGTGQIVGTATADSSTGLYTITPTTAVTNTAALSVQAVDAGGNSSTQGTVAADTTPPVTPTTSPSNGQSITGSAEPGSTVSINDVNGKVLGTTTADAVTGRFTYTPSTPLAHGTMVRVIATDAAGNFSLSSTVTVDSQAPTLPVVTTRTGTTLAGTAEPDSTVLIDLGGDGTVDRRVTVDGLGNFSASFSPALTDGQTMRISVADTMGNTSVPIPVTVDATAPAAAVVTTTTTQLLAGTAEPGATITVDVNGDGRVDYTRGVSDDRSWSIALSPAPAAGTTASITVTDTAGNRSTAATTTLTGSSTNNGGGTTPDTTAPAAAVLTTVSTNTIAGTGEAGVTVLVDVNGNGQPDYTGTVGSNGTFSITLNPPLAAGTAVSVQLRDAANNTSTATTVTATANTGGNTGGSTDPAPTSPSVSPSNGSTLTGSAQPGTTIRVDLNGDGTADLTTLAGTDGRWSITLSEPPADGTTVSITAVNAAGTASSPTTVTIDGVSPQAPVLTRVSSSVLSGRSEPLARIDVDTNGDGSADLGTTADNTGQWSITPNPALADGSTLSIRQFDRAGNPSAAVSATVDSTAPAAATVNPSNGVSFTGSAEPGATVTLDTNGDGTAELSTTADAFGAWSLTPDTRVPGGTTVAVRVTDAAGNVSTAASVTVVDTTPAAPTVNPASGTGVSGTAAPGMTILLDTNGDGLADQSTTAGNDGSWSFGFSPALADGATLAIRAVNASGETSAATTATVDAQAPAAPTVNPSNGTSLSGTAPAGVSVLIDSNGDGITDATVTADANGNWTYSFPTAASNGTTLAVTTRDAAGNVSTAVSVVVSGGAAVTAPTVNPFNGTTLAGTAQAGATIQVDTNGDGTADLTTTADSSGVWTLAISPALAHGSTLAVRAANGSGDVSSAVTVTTDAQAPAAASINASNGSTISGTAEAGSTVRIDTNGDGTPDLTATANGSGLWSVTPAAPLADGTTLSVTVVDAAGNVSAAATSTVSSGGIAAPSVNPSNGMTVSGTALPAANIAIDTNGDGNADYTASANGSGVWAVNLNPVLAHGASLSAWVVGGAGSVSPSTTISVDAQAPATPTAAASNGSTLSGTAEAGATITIDANGDGTADLTVTANNAGAWSVTPSPALAHGTVVSIRATDAAGNTSAPVSVTVDSTAPAAPTINPTNGSTISGTAEPGSQVRIDANGDGTADLTTTANGAGLWSVTPASPLANGTALSVTVVDAAGNVSAAGSATVDSNVLSAPAVNPSNGLTLSGTAFPNANIAVDTNGDGTADVTATANSGGAWSVTLSPPLAHGVSVSAWVVGGTGNTSPLTTVSVDAQAPAAPVISTSNGSTISGTAEAGSTVTIDTNGDGIADYTVTASGSGAWSVTPSPALAHGTALSISTTDAAGNTSTATSITVDATAPAAPSISASNGSTLSGTAEANATVQIDAKGDGNYELTATANGSGAWTLTPASPLAAGTTVTLRAVDAAGNASPTITLTIDGTAPAAPTANPSNGSTLSGTAEAGATIRIDTNGDGTAEITVTAGNDGQWTTALSPTLAGGTVVSIRATDAAGNASAATSVTIDGTAPAAAMVNPTNGSTVSGTAEAGATITVDTNGDGTPEATTTANGAGAWSVTLSPAPSHGSALTIGVRDAAGNAGPSASVSVDAVGPSSPTTNPSNGTVVYGSAEPNTTIAVDTNNDGTADLTTPTGGDGFWSVTPPSTLANGTLLRIWAVDAAGNIGTEATLTVNASVPSSPVVNPSNGTTLSGTAGANLLIAIDSNGDGTPDQNTVADSSGNWSITLSSPIAHGTEVAVIAATSMTNYSAPTFITIDAQAPALPVIQVNAGTTLSGTAEAGASILIDTNGDSTADYTATANGSGAWTQALSPALADGSTVAVRARDAAGNTSAAASATIDASAPAAPTVNASNGAVISGTAEANATIRLDTNGDGNADQTTTANGSGAWTASLSPALAHGATVSVVAVDAAGNVSSAATTVVDATPPAAPTVNPSNGATLSGTAEANATVLIDTNGDGTADVTVTADGSGNWTTTLTPALNDGAVVQVRSRDAAGNQSAATSVTVDTAAPTTPTVAASNGSAASGTAEANVTILIDTNGDGTPEQTVTANGSGAWTASFSPVLAHGTVISVIARDAQGNLSAAATTTVDANAPAAPTVTSFTASTLAGTAEAGATLQIDTNGDGTAEQTVTANGSGAWTASLSPALAHGTVVAVRAVDAAGNVGAATSATIDANAPTAPTISALSATAASGTAEANASVLIDSNGDGTADQTVTANGAGTWTASFSPALAQGATVSVRVRDAAGNQSAATTGLVDATAPAAPTVAQSDGSSVSGTAEANATILIDTTGDGNADQTATANGSGAWSATLSPVLADGAVISVRARDAAGNVSNASQTTVDAVAPDAPILDDSNGGTVSGLAEAGATIRIDTDGNGTANATTVADSLGNWSVTISPVLANGTVVSVVAIDAAGNTSPAATLTTDASIPSAPVVNASQGTVISGTAAANLTVELDVDADGNPDQTTTADAQGDWSVTLGSALAHGTVVIAQAVSGTGARSAITLMTVDSQAPAAPLVTTRTADTLAGTAEANAAVLIDLNNDGTADRTVNADSSGAWTTSLSPALADGSVVTVQARDASGNLSTTASATIDAIPPSMPVITPSTGSQISGTATPNTTVLIDTNGDGTPDYTTTANGAGAWSQILSPALAHNTTVTVWARDAAGNLSLTTNTATDSQAPAAAVITTRTATMLAGSAEAWQNVRVDTNNDGTVDLSTTADGTGSWSLTLSPALAHGSTVQVFVEDFAGNTSAAATATIDAQAPVTPTVQPSNGTVFSGTGTPTSTIRIDTDSNGEPNLTAVVDSNGNWTVTASPAVAHNTAASITAVDDAGNTSAAVSVTVDAVAPTVPVVNPSNGSTLSGTAEPNVTLRIDTNGDGTADQTTTASGAGLWSVTLSPALADGTVVAVRAVDATGNISSPGSVTVSAGIPNTPTVQPSNGTQLQGTATPNITLDLDWTGDGNADATTTADTNGNWSYTPAPAFAHGTNVSITAINGSGVSSAAALVVIDNVAPSAAVVAPSNGTELHGTAEAAATVGIDTNSDGTSETVVTVNSAGNWSSVLTPALAHGTVVTLRVTDAAGNVSSTTTVTIDANAPATPTITASNASTLSGTSEAGASILIDTNGDGVADQTITADGAGAWTATHSPTLAHSTALSVRARDAAGNTSAAAATTVDAVAPAAPVVSPSNGATIAGTAEANSTITVDTNGDGTAEHTTTADGTGAWTITPASAIAHGTTLTVRATDANGNASATTSRTVDANAPLPAVIAPSNGSTLSGSAEANTSILIDTNNDGSTDITVTADGSGAWTTPLSPAVAHGGTVAVRVRDAAGNTSSATTHTIDTVAPDAPVVTTRTATTLAGTGEFGATISIDLTGDGVADTSTTVDGGGNWSTALSPALADGASVQIRAIDASLNASPVTAVTIDAQAPSAPVVLPSNGTTLTGTTEPNGTVLIDTNNDNTADLTVTADGSGNWTATPAAPLANGTVVGVRVRDAAGNLGNTTQITVDAVAPATPTLTVSDSDADGNPDLRGTAEIGSMITLTDPSGATHVTTADSAGNFAFEITPPPSPLTGSYSASSRDQAGNTSATASVSTTDLTSPTIIDALPLDEGRVGSAANLIVRYSENIALGSGTIRLVSLDGGTDITIDVNNHAGQLIVNNDFLQINPSADLPLDRQYALRIDTGAITDTAGNAFAGIVNNTTLNFTTNIAPVWTSEIGTASAGFIVSGASSGDMLSQGALAGVGDVNGDGFDDFIVSTVGNDGNAGTTNDSARSYVVFGSSTGANVDLSNLGSRGFMIQGEAGNAGQPVHVSAAGDVNGDGLQDLLIGSPFNDVAGIDNGAAYVVFGRNATSTVELSNLGSAGFRISGNTLGGMAGIALAGVGDVNADGVDDVAVRVRYDDAIGLTPGNSYVVFGSSALANSTVNLNNVGSSTAGFVIVNEGTGVQADEQAPTVSAAGDINGDGYADIVIGSPFNDSGATNGGRAYVVRGSTSTAQVQLSAIAAGSSLRGFAINNNTEAEANTGYAVAGIGDFNGDGMSDMLVTVSSSDAAATDAGGAYVVFGSTSGAPINLTSLDSTGNGRGLRLIAETEAGALLGSSASAAGDINGDGLADLLVSAPRDDGIASDTGRTYVVYGRNTDAAIQLSAIAQGNSAQGFVIDGTGGADRAGQTVSAAGDLNGDGYADMLVGAPQADPSGRANAGAVYVIYGGTRYTALVDNASTHGQQTTTNGSSAAEILLGASDVDQIDGAGGADVIRSGAGNDVIIIDSTTATALMVPLGSSGNNGQLATIDGGTGYDILRLTAGAELTPMARAPRIQAIEQIDLATDIATNSVTLFATDMLQMTSRNVVNTGTGWTAGSYALGAAELRHQLVIDGTSADTLNLGGDDHPGGWQDVGTIQRNTDLYTVYNHTNAQAQVIVRQGVVINNADAALQAVSLSSLANSGQGFVINGQSMGEMSGTSAIYAGDINGDGFDDVLIGAYGAVPAAGVDAGKAYVVFGGTGTTTVELSAVEAGTGGFAIRGASAGDKAGYSLHALGDLNGDGLDDFAIGALNADVGAAADAGHSYVIYGRAATSAIDLTAVAAGTGGFVIRGESAGDESGRGISAAGDVNGDGIGDVVVEASNAAVGANVNAGRAYVVFGSSNGSAVDLSNIAAGTGGFVINGEGASDHAGSGATAAGDVNGDGLGDLVLGAYGADGAAGADSGRAYVVFGKTDTTAVNLTAVTAGTGGFMIEGQALGDAAGLSVAGMGDVNGDGLSDVAVGAHLGDPIGGADAGHSYIVYGRTAGTTIQLSSLAANAAGRVIEGLEAGARSGTAVANAGDINGDGINDLLVGAYLASPNGVNTAGAAYVVFGGTAATVNLSDVNAGSGGFAILGASNGDLAGRYVSAAGDINGDGFADLLVSAYAADPQARDMAGASYVIYGRASHVEGEVAGSGTVNGTSASEAIYGSRNADTLTGNGGTDRFYAGGGNDTIVVTTNDIQALSAIQPGATSQTVIDGGAGSDTLRLTGGANLDLSAVQNVTAGAPGVADRLQSIERIDLATDTAANTLTIQARDVVDMAGMNLANTGNGWTAGTYALGATEARHQLVVDGAATDSLVLATDSSNGGWQVAGTVSNGGNSYQVYNHSILAAQILVRDGVSVTNNDFGIAAVQLSDIANSDGGYVVNGATASTLYSVNALQGVGDVNGDGYDDFMAGSYDGGSNPHVGHVIFGGTATTARNAGTAFEPGQAAGFRIQGTASSLLNTRAAGDINGDGLQDLLVSEYSLDVVAREGRAYVVFGKTGDTVVELTNLGSQGFIVQGNTTHNHTGIDIAAAGDVNGDGQGDLIIRNAYEGGTTTPAGNTYVLFGSTAYANQTISASSIGNTVGGMVITDSTHTTSQNDWTHGVAGIGDFNGDGLADILIGSRFNDDTSTDGGRGYLVFGQTGNATVDLGSMGSQGITLVAEADANGNSLLGIVSAAGDINGDGLADALIAAYGADSPQGTSSGRAYVLYGGNTSPATLQMSSLTSAGNGRGFVINGESTNAVMGVSATAAGDVNGDGLSDLLLGSNQVTGDSFIVFGRSGDAPIQTADLRSGASNAGVLITGRGYDLSAGRDVASAGDINGDGFSDFLIGAAGSDLGGGVDAGRVYVVHGGAQFGEIYSAATTQLGTTGANTLTGTTAANTLIGGDGNDILTGQGGADVMNGGRGNDALVLNASNATALQSALGAGGNTGRLARIDGGAGFDTIELTAGASLDLTAVAQVGAGTLGQTSRIESVERIDLATDTAANTLTLAARDVVDMAGMNLIHTGTASADGNTWTNVTGTALSATTRMHQLVVDGTASDTLVLAADAGGWINAGTVSNGSNTYTAYQNTQMSAQVLVRNAVAVSNNDIAIASINLSTMAAGTGGFVLNGQGISDRSGSYVASAGDVNGDGLDDIIVGAYLSDGIAGTDSGRSYVVFGSTSTTPIELSSITAGTGGYAINGQVGNDYSGFAITKIGDVNGDGLDDLVVGAQLGDPAAGVDAGRSYVVWGKTGTTAINLSDVAAGTGGFVINGQSANDNSGYSVSGVGDFNGDGLNDFVIGAIGADPNAAANAGRAYLVYGQTGTTAINLSAVAAGTGGFVMNGESAGDTAGWDVSAAGDINGDGLGDLLVAANNADVGADTNSGRVYAVFGRTGTSALDLSSVAAGNNGFVINGLSSGEYLEQVSNLGDINGDGLADIAVGSVNSSSSFGQSYVIFGRTGTSAVNVSSMVAGNGGYVIRGISSGALASYDLHAAGDVNGDGLIDLISSAIAYNPGGAPNAGRSYVVFGQSGTAAIDLSAVVAGLGGFAMNGSQANGHAGWRVAGAADVNGDGMPDMIMGAPFLTATAGAEAGRSYVVHGSTSMLTTPFAVSTGTAASELVLGTSAADTLTGGGGTDRYQAGDGDDVIVLTSTDTANLASSSAAAILARVDGGGDFDTVRLSGGAALDLTTISNAGAGTDQGSSRINSIERIDLATDTGANTLTLAARDVVDMAGMNLIHTGTPSADGNTWTNVTGTALSATTQMHQLVVDGTASDTLVLAAGAGGWIDAGTVSNGTDTYTVYQSSVIAAQVLVRSGVGVTNNDLAMAAVNVSAMAAGTGGFVMDGQCASDRSGSYVANAGDVNGDGLDDLLVSAFMGDAAGPDTGSTYVVFGRTATTPIELSAVAAGTGGFALHGGGATDYSGNSIRAAGDVNGDGLDDLIIGAPLSDPSSRANAGRSYVVWGKTDTATLNLAMVELGVGGFVIEGATADDRSGYEVSGAGDVNGDGYADLLVGAIGVDLNGNVDVGRTYLVFGKTNTGAVPLANVALGSGGFIMNGQGDADQTGYSVSAAGDVNGDGLSDLLMAANRGDPNGVINAGQAYVVWGRTNTAAINLSSVAAGTGGFSIAGASSGEFVESVTALGDINGDGLADFAFAAQNSAPGGASSAGQAYVVFGKTGTAEINLSDVANGSGGYAIRGEFSGSLSGFDIRTAGDVNGDGIGDLIVVSMGTLPNSQSRLGFVVFGKTDTAAIDLSTVATGVGGLTINGPAAGGSGWSVSTAGDVNGDGLTDLLVGTPWATVSGGAQAGRSYLIHGSTAMLSTTYALGTGTSASELVLGTSAADTLTGGGGTDRFQAGDGRDVIVLTSSDISNLASSTAASVMAKVDGGGDFDTLRQTGGAALNLTTISNAGGASADIASRINSIERIDLATDTAANTLTLQGLDVVDMAGMNLIHTGTPSADGNTWTNVTGTALSATTDRHQLVVDGSAGDTVNLTSAGGTWSSVGTASDGTSNFTIYQDSATRAQVLVRSGVTVNTVIGPVALDLNGDGQISYAQQTMDINSDGQLDQATWVGSDDGVLVWDKHGDAQVHDASQYAFSQFGGDTDLQGLALGFDSNHDGRLDAQDARFGEFAVWRDANGNGVSDTGEVQHLASHGLTAIDLTSDSVPRQPLDGALEAGHTMALRIDGSHMLAVDVGLVFRTLDDPAQVQALFGQPQQQAAPGDAAGSIAVEPAAVVPDPSLVLDQAWQTRVMG